ncbi:3-dehydroquinate synthase [Aquisediminimonas profunda]|uniref:3-dehydroquinate synthase n=1 Tax=Aquisediminimonas profunda TaxID=1550733 RepID=UPI001C638A88|nr:3-dehydroquinate synthase [Aquisediminimonas profunda]
MSCVRVGLGSNSYDIVIESGAIRNAAEHLKPYIRGERLVIVTERNVADAVLPKLSAGLAGITLETITLDPGEGTKSWSQLERLCESLLNAGIERSDAIVALGGGVIGDLTGFAAAIIKRGCKFIQVPTSLLAQVDSSVGGKTAINSHAGKNLIGAFHQPVLVLIDPETLDTLPEREMRAGYAEVAKYGLIGDFDFFEWCEANAASIIAGDRGCQIKAIETSVRAKATIVEADERETLDTRALLNLGHTFGHALEAETGFSDKLLHGEAVAAGMALAFRFSARQGLCSAQDAERVSAHLRAVGLPDGLDSSGVKATGAELVQHMLHDKKMSGGTLPFILARGIGQAYVDKSVSLAEVTEFLDVEAR